MWVVTGVRMQDQPHLAHLRQASFFHIKNHTMVVSPLRVSIRRLEPRGDLVLVVAESARSHEADFTHSYPPFRGLLFYFHIGLEVHKRAQ